MNRPDYKVDENGKFNLPQKDANVEYYEANHRFHRIVQQKVLHDKQAEEALDGEYKRAMSKTSSEVV